MKGHFHLNQLLSTDFNQSVLTPKRIKAIRKIYNKTQIDFAELIMVNYETYRSWEEGRRIPSSPGYAILSIAENYPDVFLKNRTKIIDKIKKMGF